MRVLKFGGSSLADAEKIKQVVSIIQKKSSEGKVCVVLSAMRGVTDGLIQAAKDAEKGVIKYRQFVEQLEIRKLETVHSLFTPVHQQSISDSLQELSKELLDILHGIELVKECSKRSLDLIMSFGERMSCLLVSAYMRSLGMPAEYVDARQCILTDNRHGNAVVDFKRSYQHIKKEIGRIKGIPIITGFIASTPEGVTTTLGRNGSDYTASLIAAGLGAEAVEIWKDVDGVLSADPDKVKEAFVLDELSYEEAMEMSYFGAEVIHPYTMIPAIEKNIPIWIKNTLNPNTKGTLIARNIKRHSHAISSIASIEQVALINVEGGGMLGIPGIASRVFSVLAEAGINIIMISQASSEHSICMVVREQEAAEAIAKLKEELRTEIEAKQIEDIQALRNLEIIAVIGENMRGTPGISGKLFSALGDKGINILAIAQGSSERNISFVIESKDAPLALTTIHRAFFGDSSRSPNS
ncbi:MAG: aspartate kinase [Spirochaetales bacterium]